MPVVIYQDSCLLAVDKPAGIIVHGDGTGARTLTDLVRELPGAEAAQAVQRLDRDTTGLVLFSLSKRTQPALDAAIAAGEVDKRYLALVRGRFPEGETRIDKPLGRDRHDARRMRVSATGKPSRTLVRLLRPVGRDSLVECRLITGRRHQIRVHLASLGFPLVGDVLYGGPKDARGLMLHAWRERLAHPATGEQLDLQTDWPERFPGM